MMWRIDRSSFVLGFVATIVAAVRIDDDIVAGQAAQSQPVQAASGAAFQQAFHDAMQVFQQPLPPLGQPFGQQLSPIEDELKQFHSTLAAEVHGGKHIFEAAAHTDATKQIDLNRLKCELSSSVKDAAAKAEDHVKACREVLGGAKDTVRAAHVASVTDAHMQHENSVMSAEAAVASQMKEAALRSKEAAITEVHQMVKAKSQQVKDTADRIARAAEVAVETAIITSKAQADQATQQSTAIRADSNEHIAQIKELFKGKDSTISAEADRKVKETGQKASSAVAQVLDLIPKESEAVVTQAFKEHLQGGTIALFKEHGEPRERDPRSYWTADQQERSA
jgi:hypothetical protein